MSEREHLVTAVLQAADGQIIGRIRMQKVVYLLEQLGLDGGFWFSYHHYGPYSEELSDVLDGLVKREKTVEEEQVPTENGFYSIYRLRSSPTQVRASLGRLPWDRAKAAIQTMAAETSVVIELAATIYWLRMREKVADWKKELKIRKPSKASDPDIEKALALLGRLDLAGCACAS
jgi:uncharacterized protein YwgA